MLIPDKSTGDDYNAAEFTSFKNEVQNAIESGGETLDGGDTNQLSKRLSMAGSHDDFYTSSYTPGSPGNYQLTGPIERNYPFEYKIGLRIRFIVDTENASDDDTIKVGSLSALPVSIKILANGETPFFEAGTLKANKSVIMIYNETPDGLTKYWLVEGVKDVITRSFDISSLTWVSSAGFWILSPNINLGVPYVDTSKIAYNASIAANTGTDIRVLPALDITIDDNSGQQRIVNIAIDSNISAPNSWSDLVLYVEEVLEDLVETIDNSMSVTSLTRSGTTATCVTAVSHNLVTGADVTFSGANEAEWNTTWSSINSTGPSSFTFTVAGTETTPATGTILVSSS